MPYCPQCQAEYESSITTCAECGVALVAALPDDEPVIEVFRSGSPESAERVRAVVLGDLETFVRNRSSQAFPAPAASSGAVFVGVSVSDAEQARQLLTEAVQDGALTADDGEILEPESESE